MHSVIVMCVTIIDKRKKHNALFCDVNGSFIKFYFEFQIILGIFQWDITTRHSRHILFCQQGKFGDSFALTCPNSLDKLNNCTCFTDRGWS